MLVALLNGVDVTAGSSAIAIDDRGLQYGDGVFETMLLRTGGVRFFDQHLARLKAGCERLGFAAPRDELLRADITWAASRVADGVLKIVVTRGPGGRGYRPPGAPTPTRLVTVHALPEGAGAGVRVRWCETRLARNPRLAGIKHLNRLEQVLAQAEWADPQIQEGLMLDTEGELVCATAANIFIARDGMLLTPDLRFCGVRGVMREQVLRAAGALGIAVSEEALRPEDLESASEVFLTSAVRGIRPVLATDALSWSSAPIATRLARSLGL